MKDNRRKNLLVEYQMAQDSAQHHDNLYWAIITLIWGSMLVMLGFIVKSINPVDNDDALNQSILLLISIIGVFLTFFVCVATYVLINVKRDKYERCIQIEKKLKMKQHSELKYNNFINSINIFINILFGVLWAYIIFSLLCKC